MPSGGSGQTQMGNAEACRRARQRRDSQKAAAVRALPTEMAMRDRGQSTCRGGNGDEESEIGGLGLGCGKSRFSGVGGCQGSRVSTCTAEDVEKSIRRRRGWSS